jgi:hypothetical protein
VISNEVIDQSMIYISDMKILGGEAKQNHRDSTCTSMYKLIYIRYLLTEVKYCN